MTTTREQDLAAEFVAEHDGSARVDDFGPDGMVRITGLRADGAEARRWIVRADGGIWGAWDADGLMETYLAERQWSSAGVERHDG